MWPHIHPFIGLLHPAILLGNKLGKDPIHERLGQNVHMTSSILLPRI